MDDELDDVLPQGVNAAQVTAAPGAAGGEESVTGSWVDPSQGVNDTGNPLASTPLNMSGGEILNNPTPIATVNNKNLTKSTSSYVTGQDEKTSSAIKQMTANIPGEQEPSPLGQDTFENPSTYS